MKHDAILELNGKEIMRSDRESVRAIFNNLTGRNFAERPEWEIPGTHSDYLATMAEQLHVGHWAGALVVRIDGAVDSEFHFPAGVHPPAQPTLTPEGNDA